MPGRFAATAAILARDETIGDTEIAAVLNYMDTKIRMAEETDAPVPFIAFRTRAILMDVRNIRRSWKRKCW